MTPAERTELEELFRNCEAGLTYRDSLRAVKLLTKVRRIFEWGPGASTLFLHELFPKAEIYGVEHDAAWMKRCERLMQIIPQVHITHERIDSPQRNGCYVTAPLYLGGEFDLMFVDGRLRRDCLGVAQFCLSKGGVAVLHDANRAAYHPAFSFYKQSEIKDDTIVLRPLRQLT